MKKKDKIAIWAITPKGSDLALRIAEKWTAANLFFSDALAESLPSKDARVHRFARLKEALEKRFRDYAAHIFIMSTGIVVRMIAPLIRHKTEDPAVLVLDEKGRHVISLLSGHIGGANALTLEVADWIGADPVITTATDVNQVPAVDVLAMEKGLFIENPGAIKNVNMALVKGDPILLHDPCGFLRELWDRATVIPFGNRDGGTEGVSGEDRPAGVFIDDVRADLPEGILVLRPPSLVAGIGCNRNTGADELKGFLLDVMDRSGLSPGSLKGLASIDIKADEAGLLALAEELNLPLQFFKKDALNNVETIKTPSTMVEKHTGAKSVCEAAAILGSNQGQLIVPKQKTGNVTVAIARISLAS
ncbi:MAG: cobalt-precorrin 5A hydrolase [Pseudomonadota bacterium]